VLGTNRRVARRTARRVARRQQGMQESQEAPPAEYGEAAPDPAEELQKLADLHKQGILTDEEFAAKKEANPGDPETLH
jgi:hypothetical protein